MSEFYRVCQACGVGTSWIICPVENGYYFYCLVCGHERKVYDEE